MKNKFWHFVFALITICLLIIFAYLIYILIKGYLNDQLEDYAFQMVIAFGCTMGLAALLGKLHPIAYRDTQVNTQSSKSSISSSQPDDATPLNPQEFSEKNTQVETHQQSLNNSNQNKPIPKPKPTKYVALFIVLFIIIIVFIGVLRGSADDPIVGTWVNESMLGPWDDNDTDYVYMDIFEDGFLTINYVTTSGSDNVYGSGHWEKEADGYLIHIRYVWAEDEDIYVYIVDDVFYLSENNTSWNFRKTE